MTISMLFAVITGEATDYYISPKGSNDNPGTAKEFPFASLAKAQSMVRAGDTVYILPGTYQVTELEMMDCSSSAVWDIVYDFGKSGTANQHISYQGVSDGSGNRPVFDVSAINTGKRITAFYVHGKFLDFSGFEIIGLQVPLSSSNTQSENFRINGASHCTFRYIAAHDGMGIGFYLTGKSAYNEVVDCDAYNNFDSVNCKLNNGGNNDGFGCHVAVGCEGNRFLRCRAWQNSDDGFDFINCFSVATAEYCIAYRNGFDKDGVRRADGNGFKAGGYGMSKAVSIGNVPMHVVSHCLSVANKANGFYANHHLGGVKFENNSAYKNGKYDFSMVCRRGTSLEDAVDVDGYGHVLLQNVSFGKPVAISNVDVGQCKIEGNSFVYSDGTWVNDELEASDFVSLSQREITAQRQKDGTLPDIRFMRLKDQGLTYGYGSLDGIIPGKEPSTGISKIIRPNEKKFYFNLMGMPTISPEPGHVYIYKGKKLYVKVK